MEIKPKKGKQKQQKKDKKVKVSMNSFCSTEQTRSQGDEDAMWVSSRNGTRQVLSATYDCWEKSYEAKDEHKNAKS